MAGHVLILGSGPNVTECQGWDLTRFSETIAINNAWRVRPDWSVSIFPDDFPPENRPAPWEGQRIVQSDTYIPAQNAYGGVVYAGATMALTASYWALAEFEPDVIGYIGCDMVYPNQGPTHFYGTGTADPLRADPTLQCLEAKLRRLQALAGRQGCGLVNFSKGPSRLPYPRGKPDRMAPEVDAGDLGAVAAALRLEIARGIQVPGGRYWEEDLDQDALAEIDALWRGAYPEAPLALEA